jgi:hypothetical protein
VVEGEGGAEGAGGEIVGGGGEAQARGGVRGDVRGLAGAELGVEGDADDAAQGVGGEGDGGVQVGLRPYADPVAGADAVGGEEGGVAGCSGEQVAGREGDGRRR